MYLYSGFHHRSFPNRSVWCGFSPGYPPGRKNGFDLFPGIPEDFPPEHPGMAGISGADRHKLYKYYIFLRYRRCLGTCPVCAFRGDSHQLYAGFGFLLPADQSIWQYFFPHSEKFAAAEHCTSAQSANDRRDQLFHMDVNASEFLYIYTTELSVDGAVLRSCRLLQFPAADESLRPAERTVW